MTEGGYGTGNDLLTTISMGGVTTQAINYTGDGNMANLNPGIQAPGGSLITSLGWNQNARLSAVKSGSNILARYDYDGFGQRVVKTISATDVTLYQYGQDGMLLEEATYKGVPLADYIYLAGRPIATLTPSGTLYFLQDDLLGTPQLATDSSQNLAWRATYTPFGQASVSGTLTQNLRLPGQYFDSEGGWNHNGFRNYLPDLGRYVEPDPLAMMGTSRFYDTQTGRLIRLAGNGMSFYPYVQDSPANLVDFLGLWPQQAPHNNPPPGCTWPSCFWYYGNWGGPGWSGGQWKPLEDLTPEGASKLAPPIDAQDACYMQHDYCYSHSRQKHGGRSCRRDEGKCDGTLGQCLRNAAESNPSSYNPASAAANQWFMLSSWWKSINWNSVVQVLGPPMGPSF